MEPKSEAELIELSKHYSDTAEESEKSGELHTPQSIEHMLNREMDKEK